MTNVKALKKYRGPCKGIIVNFDIYWKTSDLNTLPVPTRNWPISISICCGEVAQFSTGIYFQARIEGLGFSPLILPLTLIFLWQQTNWSPSTLGAL